MVQKLLLTVNILIYLNVVQAATTIEIPKSLISIDENYINDEGTSRLYGSIIKQILNGIRDQLPTGVFGLPPLDPFEMDFFETLDVDNNIGLNLTFWNLTVEGLSQFVTKEADYSLRTSRITINITIPYIMLTAIYDLDSNIDLGAYPYPLHGKGHMNVTLYDIDIHFSCRIGVITSNMQTKLEISLQKSYINLEGLMYHMPGFGDFLNELLTLLLPGAMDHIIWPILQPILENLIDTYGNEALGGITILKLLELILGMLFPFGSQ